MTTIHNRYRVMEKLGAGSFGVIYKAYDAVKDCHVALKMEPANAPIPQLLYEYKVYRVLNPSPCFPKVYDFYYSEAVHHGRYNIMPMELMEGSLEHYFDRCKRRFTVKTVCQIAVQAIEAVKQLHEKCFLHRDIKPDNFMLKDGRICMIDMGLVKRYRDPTTHVHIPYSENKRLTGTPRYASINMHLGIQSSRRDDLESLAYMFLYFLRGSLPWQGMRARDKRQKYQKIMEKKLATPIDLLCKGYPDEFLRFLEYVRCLRFADKPDYDYLKKLFKDIGVRLGFTLDGKWDWDSLLEVVIEEEDDNCSNRADAPPPGAAPSTAVCLE